MTSQQDIDVIWQELEVGIQETYEIADGMTPKRFMELYSYVYNYCTNTVSGSNGARVRAGRSKRRSLRTGQTMSTNYIGHDLYVKINEYLINYLSNLCKGGINLVDEELLKFYVNQWERYTLSSKVLNGFCSYLNRHWVRRECEEGHEHVFQIYNCCLDIWKETFFSELCDNTTSAILSLIKDERNGSIINTGLINGVINSYVELSAVGSYPNAQLQTYQEKFEIPFLKETETFYLMESINFLEKFSVTDYMKRAELRLNEEKHRVETYLHYSTMKKLLETCENVLIHNQLEVLNQEFRVLLQNEKSEDIARMYQLVSRLEDSLEQMKEHFEAHVENQGLLAIDQIKESAFADPKLFVKTILDVHEKYYNLMKTAFQADSGFAASLDKACGKFINSNPITASAQTAQKSPELLARYCDALLKSHGEEDIEENLNRVMIVFKYLDDKDVFQKFYSLMLANRLVLHLSSSEDAESSMIGKLKHVCGFEYTAKLQRMFQDVSLSKDLNSEFKQFLMEKQGVAASPLTGSMEVLILTSGSWPFPPSPEFLVPGEMEQLILAFKEYYDSKHTGRKLTWLFNRSRGDLVATCLKPQYTFQASVFQIAVLLMYNNKDSYRMEEIMETTQIAPDILKQVLQTLVRVKLLNLPLDQKEEHINESSTLTFNSGFKSKKVRVNINVPLRNEAKIEEDKTRTAVEDDRKWECQAAIVRVMKNRKTLDHANLVAEVIALLSHRFKPSVALIKKSIDILITKDYLSRDDQKSDVYQYVA